MFHTLRNILTSIPALIVYLALLPFLATTSAVLSFTTGDIWSFIPHPVIAFMVLILPGRALYDSQRVAFVFGVLLGIYFTLFAIHLTNPVSIYSQTFVIPITVVLALVAILFISIELRHKLTARKTQSV